MNYVTDLLNVKPEEILHLESGEVQAIVHCPKAESNRTVLVVFKNNSFTSYTQAGESYVGGSCRFIYKPRTKRVLKPLHQILTENPNHMFTTSGCLYFENNTSYEIHPECFRDFDGKTMAVGWPENFYMEDEAS